jgi:magnesium chelatase family protein
VPGAVLERFEVIGELGLYGEIRPVRGALSAAIAAGKAGRGIIVPWHNRHEVGSHGASMYARCGSRRCVCAAA